MSKLKNLLNTDLKDYQPIPFWSWNDKLDSQELRSQIRDMKQAGIGGFFMHARGGLQTEYLSEDWFEATRACIEEAGIQNMNAWCYDENGWPSGFAGMKLLEDSENFVHYIICEHKTVYDENALAVYKLINENLSRIHTPEDGVLDYICIYDHTNSSVVDILNKDIIAKFIKETHEKYYDRFKTEFGNAMLGFFTDEPQYYRWDTAYSPVMLTEFKTEYGEDLLDSLGALFVDCNQSYELRFKYWRLMNKLFVSSFAKQIYDWCDEHNCKLTGHAVEESRLAAQMWCCAGVMPFYEYEHIPGIDWLGREIANEITPRQVSSVAQQLGKKQVLTETFACTGWDVTPKELKRIAEWQYVNGVNLLCQHLYPYSIRGQRKRDYPTFFSNHNPWTSNFKVFNDYFTTLGYLLSNSKELARVGIIHPMHSAYLTYNRETDYDSVKQLEDDFGDLVELFGSSNIVHHYIDELLLEKHGRVEGSSLVMGECHYDYIVIPQMECLDTSTVNLLQLYLEHGGNIYLVGTPPCYVDGKKTNLDFLNSNTTFEELQNQVFHISDTNTEIRSTYRTSEFGDFLYTVNLSKDKEYSVSFHVDAKGASLFNLETKEETQLYFTKTDCGIEIPLKFKAGDSFVLMLNDTASSPHPISYKHSLSLQPVDMTIVDKTANALTIDYAQLSYDNCTFEESLPIMALSDRLLREKTNRTIYLKYTFTVLDSTDELFIESETMNNTSIAINGTTVTFDAIGTLDKSFIRMNLRELIKVGCNEIIFTIDYFQNQHVYDVFNGVYYKESDYTESFLNCMSYDTDIEAIYILGNFCVLSNNGYTKGSKNTSISNGHFAITPAKTTIDASNLVEQGFPFFAGELTLEKQITLESTSSKLTLLGRFALADIFLNDNFVARLMFDNSCDLSKFAIAGENKLTIKLTNSNRNLYGPFHYAKDNEPYGVGPDLLSQYGTWDHGKSPFYSDDYSFTHFGIDKMIVETI